MTRWAWLIAASFLVVGAIGGYVVAVLVLADPIAPVRVSQFYGTVESHEGDTLCMRAGDRVRCARLRLRPEDRIPPVGSHARGGYAEIPSDSSDPREPSWLWVSKLATE